MRDLPTNAISPALVQGWQQEEGIPAGERWEKFLALSLPLLIGSMLLVHFAPAAFLWVTLAALFLVALLMGVTGAIPSYDDAIADCAIVLVISLLLGPLLALIVYFVVGLIRQEMNPAVTALLLSNIVVRSLLGVAFQSSADTLSLLAMYGMFSLLLFVTVIASFAGWLMSGFFRPVNAS
jgi:hypothetical protein